MATVTTTKAASEDKELLISGSEAVAESLTLADIDVVTAYPIRPYDTVMQAIAKKIAKDRKSTRLNSSHVRISYAVFCLKKKKKKKKNTIKKIKKTTEYEKST